MLRRHHPSINKKKQKTNFSKRALSNLSFKTKSSQQTTNNPQQKKKLLKKVEQNENLKEYQFGSFKGYKNKKVNQRQKLQKSRDFFEGYYKNLSFVLLNKKTQKNNRFKKCVKNNMNQFLKKKQSKTQNKLAKKNNRNNKVHKTKLLDQQQDLNFNSKIEDLRQNIQKKINQQKKKEGNKILKKKKSIEIDIRQLQNSFQKTKTN